MLGRETMSNAGVNPPYYTIRMIIPNVIFICKFFLLTFFIVFPRDVLNAAREGLLLWFNNVLPALLPFIVVVNLLVAYGFVKKISWFIRPVMKWVFRLPGAGGFALITGLISGYPMGAKTVADLHKAGEISTSEAQRLLAFCNNAGPLFIVGVVGVGLLGDSAAGYVLWAGHVAAALLVGILTRGSGNVKDNKAPRSEAKTLPNFGKALGEAVKNAMEALLLVGGLIIFFSVIVRVVMVIVGDMPFIGMLAGILEVTGGVKILADTASNGITSAQMAAIGGIIAFGGFSVHAQALHFTSGTGIRAGRYLFFKLVNGLIAAVVTGVAWGALV